MLRIDTVQTLEGLQVYRDDAVATTHYVLPEQPRFRLDDEGRPVFRRWDTRWASKEGRP